MTSGDFINLMSLCDDGRRQQWSGRRGLEDGEGKSNRRRESSAKQPTT